MIKKKDVCILKFTEPANSGNIVKSVVIDKKTVVITRGFDDTKIIGKATNIITKNDGLYADLEYSDDGLFNNAYPSIRFDKFDDDEVEMIDCKLMTVAVGHTPHAQKSLENNLKPKDL